MIEATGPIVRPVHRIVLDTDRFGCITARNLMDVPPLPPGAFVVLECGNGWWMHSSDLEHIRCALSGVGHVSVTGIHDSRKGGVGQFGLIYGIDAIAAKLGELLNIRQTFEVA